LDADSENEGIRAREAADDLPACLHDLAGSDDSDPIGHHDVEQPS
jgi:hypothetical protein